jgi:hypothetical protein
MVFWGGKIRCRSLSFSLLCIVVFPLFSISRSLLASGPEHTVIVQKALPAVLKASQLLDQALTELRRLQTNEAFRKALVDPASTHTEANTFKEALPTRFETIEAAMDTTEKAIAEAEMALSKAFDGFDTDSGKRLAQLRSQFQKTIALFKGGSEVATKLQRQDADVVMDRVGPWLAPVIEAHVIEGGESLRPVLDVLELGAASVVLAQSQLQLAHAFSVYAHIEETIGGVAPSDRQWPIPRISLSYYRSLRSLLEKQLERFRAIFPRFPELTLGILTQESHRKRLVSELDRFVSSFSAPGKGYLRDHLDRIRSATQLVVSSFSQMQQYSNEAFPNLSIDEEGMRLTLDLLLKPEFIDCVSVAAGTEPSNSLEGPPCDIKKFPQTLKNFTEHHERIAGYGLLPAILSHLGKQETDIRLKKKSWKEIAEELDEEVSKMSVLNKETRNKWAAVRKALFQSPAELESRLGKGFELHDFVATCLIKSGVNPLLGLDTHFSPTLLSSKAVLESFESAIPSNAMSIERLSSVSDCRAFTTANAKESPYVVWTEKIVPMDPEQGRWTTSDSSTYGFQRLIWRHSVRVGNAASLPGAENSKAYLAGALKWTALSRYIPNLVLLKLFHQGALRGDTLSSLGIEEKHSEFDQLFARRKGIPHWEPLIQESKAAFSSMLEGFASAHAEWVTPETAKDEQALRVLFRERYRQELVLAAEEMRRWGNAFKELTTGTELDEVSSAIRSTPPGELCRLFGLDGGHCPPGVENALSMQLMRDLFPEIRYGYLSRHLERQKGEDARSFHDRVVRTAKTTLLTPAMFMEELVMHKGIIGSEEGASGLTSEEIVRFKKYERSIPSDQYLAWARSISQLQKIHEHTQNIYARRKSSLEEMRSILLHLFPPLKVEAVNPHTGQKQLAWEWFSNNPGDFDLVMNAYIEQATQSINEIQALETEAEVLDHLLPVLPLVDQTLHLFPEHKKTTCTEYAAREFWEKMSQRTLAVAELGGAAAMGLGPVGVAVGAGTVGLAIAMDYQSLKRKSEELARTKAHELASWSQVSLTTSSASTATIDSLEKAYAAEQSAFAFRTGISAAFAGYSALKNVAVLARVPRALGQANAVHIAGTRSLLGLPPLPPPEGFFRYWSRFGSRFTRSIFRLDKKAYAELVLPLERQGLLHSWAHPTLAMRWNAAVAGSGRLWAAKWAGTKSLAVGRWAWDLLKEYPASFIGKSIGVGLPGQAVQFYFLWGGAQFMTGTLLDYFVHLKKEHFWDLLSSDPERFEPLMLRVLNGELSSDGLIALIEADEHLRETWWKANEAVFKEEFTAEFTRDDAIERLKALHAEATRELSLVSPNDIYQFPRQRQLRELAKRIRDLERGVSP